MEIEFWWMTCQKVKCVFTLKDSSSTCRDFFVNDGFKWLITCLWIEEKNFTQFLSHSNLCLFCLWEYLSWAYNIYNWQLNRGIFFDESRNTVTAKRSIPSPQEVILEYKSFMHLGSCRSVAPSCQTYFFPNIFK